MRPSSRRRRQIQRRPSRGVAAKGSLPDASGSRAISHRESVLRSVRQLRAAGRLRSRSDRQLSFEAWRERLPDQVGQLPKERATAIRLRREKRLYVARSFKEDTPPPRRTHSGGSRRAQTLVADAAPTAGRETALRPEGNPRCLSSRAIYALLTDAPMSAGPRTRAPYLPGPLHSKPPSNRGGSPRRRHYVKPLQPRLAGNSGGGSREAGPDTEDGKWVCGQFWVAIGCQR